MEEEKEASSEETKTTMNDDEMSQNVTKMHPPIRRRYVLENRAQKSIHQIAKDCRVSTQTINRDIRKLKDSGGWQEWIELELLRLHIDEELDVDTKYREMAKLYARTITQKTEVKAEGDLEFILKAWRPEKETNPDA